jgi:hypothetical protein
MTEKETKKDDERKDIKKKPASWGTKDKELHHTGGSEQI